jgi:hypothetical protein
VTADEGHDEELVFGGQLGKGGRLETALDGDAAFFDFDSLDGEGGSPGQSGQFLPVIGHFDILIFIFIIFIRNILKKININIKKINIFHILFKIKKPRAKARSLNPVA